MAKDDTPLSVFDAAFVTLCDLHEWDIIDLGESGEKGTVKEELIEMLQRTRPMSRDEAAELAPYLEQWRALDDHAVRLFVQKVTGRA